MDSAIGKKLTSDLYRVIYNMRAQRDRMRIEAERQQQELKDLENSLDGLERSYISLALEVAKQEIQSIPVDDRVEHTLAITGVSREKKIDTIKFVRVAFLEKLPSDDTESSKVIGLGIAKDIVESCPFTLHANTRELFAFKSMLSAYSPEAMLFTPAKGSPFTYNMRHPPMYPNTEILLGK